MEPLEDDLTMPPKDSAEVAWRINAIKAKENEIAQFQKQKKEAEEFYMSKINGRIANIHLIEEQIAAFLSANEMKTLTTHGGTATLATTVERTWPASDVLIAFAKKENIPDAVKVTESPILASITKHMKESGNVPEGYMEQPKTSLRIRT